MSASLPPGINLCQIPAAHPPSGHVPNFANPTSLASVSFAICIILTVFSVFLVGVRLYTNFRELKMADYFMAMAAVLTITYTGLILSLNRYNRHQWDVPACWMNAHYLRIIFSHTTIVGAVLFFPKCAIFLMYRQIFPGRPMKYGVWIGLIFTFCIYFPSIPLSAIYEAPKPGHTWEQLLKSLSSSKDHTLIYWGIVQGSCSVALDLYIFALPLSTLFKLKLAMRKRLQLVVLFATALFGVVASVIALVFRVDLLHNADSTWDQARLAICVVTENNVAIAVGCMPAVAKFVRQNAADLSAFRSLRSKLRGSTGKEGSYPTGMVEQEKAMPKGTFGSGGKKYPLRKDYYEIELTDSTLMQTQVTVVDEENGLGTNAKNTNKQGGIIRTVDIVQQSQPGSKTQSVEQLL